MQSRDGPGAEFDRLRAGGQQHPNGFSFSAAARLAEADTGERLPSRSHGVDVVALHPATTCGPLRTVDLNDPVTPSEQRRGQSGTEAAGAFDGPQRRVVALPEGDQLVVASRIGGNRQVFEDSARRADGRRGVGVLVSVDADDDTKIWMESQHAVRSLAEWKDIDLRPERRCGKTVMSHTRRADKLLIRPTHDSRVRRRQQGRTSPIEGTISGPISFWVTSLPPAPVSDAASRNRRNPDSQSVLTGTTSHQHYQPPHQPPGHDLAIDLKKAWGFTVLTGSQLGQQHAGQATVAVPLGVEDAGFEPARGLHPTRFPSLPWAGHQCSGNIVRRRLDAS